MNRFDRTSRLRFVAALASSIRSRWSCLPAAARPLNSLRTPSPCRHVRRWVGGRQSSHPTRTHRGEIVNGRKLRKARPGAAESQGADVISEEAEAAECKQRAARRSSGIRLPVLRLLCGRYPDKRICTRRRRAAERAVEEVVLASKRQSARALGIASISPLRFAEELAVRVTRKPSRRTSPAGP